MYNNKNIEEINIEEIKTQYHIKDTNKKIVKDDLIFTSLSFSMFNKLFLEPNRCVYSYNFNEIYAF